MGGVWSNLHSVTVYYLIDAEAHYNTGSNKDQAILSLTKPVESVLHTSLIAPLCEFIRKSSKGSMSFRFSLPRGFQDLNQGRVKKLSFGEWADIFEGLGEKRQGFAALSRDEFGDFLTNQMEIPLSLTCVSWQERCAKLGSVEGEPPIIRKLKLDTNRRPRISID
jgi:hypothetical protein